MIKSGDSVTEEGLHVRNLWLFLMTRKVDSYEKNSYSIVVVFFFFNDQKH